MDGKCRPSPHRGHYWVEDIPESDKWECRWCGRVRHFNQERTEKAQLPETAFGATEYVSQHWLCRRAERRASTRIREDALESELGAYSSLSSG